MEETPQEKQGPEEEEKVGSVQQWVGDNLRLIISIVIVIALGVTIYSYSQRTKESTVVLNDEQNTQEQVSQENENAEEGSEEGAQPSEESTSNEMAPSETTQQAPKPETTSVETVKETGDAIVATAAQGDGLTHLARGTLKDHLAKNPDTTLTVAHKIYIEDALRKAVGYKGHVHVGTEVSFSKSLIQDMIGQSKNLSDKQLQNIQTKYVPLVPSLT